MERESERDGERERERERLEPQALKWVPPWSRERKTDIKDMS